MRGSGHPPNPSRGGEEIKFDFDQGSCVWFLGYGEPRYAPSPGIEAESRKGMRWSIYTALVVWCLVGGVAQAQAAAQSEEEALLKTRVVSYWQAEVEKGYVASYQFLEPGVRAALPLPDFVRRQRYLTVKSVRVQGIQINGDSATVEVEYELEVELPPPPPGLERMGAGPVSKAGVLTERWVRVSGTWFRTFSGAR